MNHEKFTLEVLDLLRRHELVGEESPMSLHLSIEAPWIVELKLEY